ncbi:MAG TPA: hypothetical protein VFQ92_03110 [Blastocatellia bacterium]|nr:hypothetical protein [Blastocatellia bacterium]
MKRVLATACLALMLLLSAACERAGQPSGEANKNEPANSNAGAANDNAAPPDGASSGREPGDTSAEDFEGTAGIVAKPKEGIRPVVLTEVRTARHMNFDRVVFEFSGDTLPGYHVEYIDRPVRRCGSGEVVNIAGDGWLLVRLVPAQAHTEAGEATVKDRRRVLGYSIVKELESICDFEAHVEWVLGVSSPNRYRVIELSSPARLVLDVKH